MSKTELPDFIRNKAFEELQELLRKREILTPEEAARTQYDFEKQLREKMKEVERSIHQKDLSRMDVDSPGLMIDGVRYRRAGKSNGTYFCVAGPVVVPRTRYVGRGPDKDKKAIPLEMATGIMGGSWTPRAAEVASSFVAALPPRQASNLLKDIGMMTPSPAHLDRLPKLFNELWEASRLDLEALVRETEELPAREKVIAVGVSLDGVMVPMKGAPRSSEADGPNGFKEASCGTIFLLDAEGERLVTLRHGRMPESKKVSLTEWLEAELKRMKELYPKAIFVGIADGAHENWRILSALALSAGVALHRVLDFFHLMEHVGEALKAAYGDSRQQEAIEELDHWRTQLQESSHAPRKLVGRLEELVQEACTKTVRQLLERELAYVKDNHRRKRLRYAWLRKRNLPIGSGIQEAACKTLVTQRLKLAGQSWAQPGGQGVLTLRSLEQSNRYEAAWSAFRTEVLRRPFQLDPDTGRNRPQVQSC